MTRARGRVAGLVAALLLLGGCGGDPEAASVGDLVQGRLDDVSGTSYEVLVPAGAVTVTLSEPMPTVAPELAADAQEHVAPDGAVWVTVDWGPTSAELDPSHRALMTDPRAETSLVLVAGEERVELGAAIRTESTPAETRTSGPVHVLLPDDSEPVIEVDFAGRASWVDTGTGEVTGASLELADLKPPTSADCPALEPSGPGTAEISCAHTVTSVPYLAGRGWSEGWWTVAQVETRVDSFEVDARLDTLVTRTVADGDPGRLRIGRTLTGSRLEGEGPERATLTLSGSVPLD